ncbi:MAG: hypothetical protein GOU98_03015 [Candidatus Altiarchaeota archaeon]|nr:hypothetical protein [Candidatus Altiarchaeota archaeon]
METFIIEAFVAMILAYFFGSWVRKYFKAAGLVGTDIHKKGTPSLPSSAGIPTFLSFYFAAMMYVFLRTYLYQDYSGLLDVMAGILSIAFITFVGFLDDVYVAKNKRIGLKQWQKPLLTLPAAIPIMALRLGNSTMSLPFFGEINFGLFYPLFLVPFGIMIASNLVNLLAGLNGLESGLGIIYLTSLSLYTYFYSNIAAKILAFSALGAIAGIFLLNKYPAKILPGDSLTYFLGGVLAIISIVGNVEKAGMILAIPFGIESLLKLKGKFKQPTVGKLVDGKIVRHGGIYSIPHFFMNGKYTEKEVVKFIWTIELAFASLIWIV